MYKWERSGELVAWIIAEIAEIDNAHAVHLQQRFRAIDIQRLGGMRKWSVMIIPVPKMPITKPRARMITSFTVTGTPVKGD